MRFRFRLLLLTAFWPAAAAADAAPRRELPAAQTVPSEKDPRKLPPPIAFFLAKGEPDACGPGCSEWIAADGTITPDADQRFAAFLRKLGKQKPPVYFHSPGGTVRAGLAIGRMLRERRMTAGVGRTIPQGCDPLQEREAACDAMKRSGRELRAELRTARTLCNSSCVYALLGAVVREVPPGARLGVHATAPAQIDKDGLVKPLSRKFSPTEERLLREAANTRLTRYAVEMGIDRALIEAAAQIKHEQVRFLSRDEIARFGIDRREFQESRWMVDEGPPGPLSVLKYVTEVKAGEGKHYRTTRMRLTCGSFGNVIVQYVRELGPADRPTVSIAMTMHSGDFVLPPSRSKPIVGYNDIEMESRFVRVPFSLLEGAASGGSIDILEAPDSAAPDRMRPPTKLSTAGLAPALAALRGSCR